MKKLLRLMTMLWLLCLGLVVSAYAQCVPITVTEDAPYTEDFESYSAVAGSGPSTPGSQDLPACWSAIYTGSSADYRPHLMKGSSTYHNNSTCMVLCAGTASTYGNNTYLIMPAVTNNLSTLRLAFDLDTESTTSGKLTVGYMTDPTDSTTFVPVQSNIANSITPVRKVIDFSGVNTTGNVYIAFRWVHNSSWYYASFDNIRLFIAPDCPAPTNLAVTPFESYTVGQNTKFRCDFSWQDASQASSYEYTFVPTGTTPTWTGITTSVTSSTTGNEVAPLDAATTYDLYVRVNNCTNAAGAPGVREIAGPLTITTPCLPLPIPYTADFTDLPYSSSSYGTASSPLTDNMFPLCWDMPANTYSTYDCRAHIYYASASNYNNALVMNAGNATTGCIAILPEFIGDITNFEILFDAKKSSATGTLSLGYYHNDTYTVLQEFDGLSTTWVSYDYVISSLITDHTQTIPTDARLAFRFIHTSNSTTYYALVDNIIVRHAPDCLKPTGLTATQIGSNSATLTWDANGSTAWIVAYGAPGLNPESPTVTTQTVTTNSLALTNLNPNTNYEFYVKPVCPNDGITYWSEAGSFKTACEAISVPWIETFDDVTFPPTCWSVAHIEGPGTNLWQRNSSTTYGGSAGSAQLPNMNGLTKTNLVTPLTYIPTANTYQVSFRIYRVSNSSKRREGVKVWVNTSPDTIGATSLIHITRAYENGDITETAAGWYQYFATIPTSGNVYIIFEGISEYGNATYVDDIAVTNCYPPASLAVSQITTSTAHVSWTPADEETSWVLYWRTSTGVADSVVVNNTPSYTITGLAPQSSYTVKVKSLCSATDHSFYSREVPFTTPCPAMTITENAPYFEGFENYNGVGYGANATMPSCWEFTGISKYTPGVYSGGSNYCTPVSGTQSLILYSSGTTATNTAGSIVVLPPFTNPLNTLQMSFLCMSESTTSTIVYQVGYMTNPADASTFVSLEDLPKPASKAFVEHEILFPQYSNIPDGARIAIKYLYNTSTDYCASIDSVVVSLAPTCLVPGNVTLSNLTASSATVRWGAPESRTTTYQVHITDGTLNDTISTPNQYCDLNNLAENTSYTVKVRAICPEGPTDWSESIQFTTPCASFVVTQEIAFVETFDNITSGIPTCWDNSEGTTTTASYRWNSYEEGYQGRGIRFNSYTNTRELTNMLKTIPIDLTQVSTAELSFYWKYGTNTTLGDFSVYISTDGGATYPTALATGLKNSNEWTLKTIDLSDYCGTGLNPVVIVFKGTSDCGSYYLYLDNVRIAPVVNCDAPADLAVSEVTNNSAKVTWTMEEGITYNIRYTSENQDVVTIPNATSPYVCTGLQGNTTYAFMVQGSCGEGEGWSLYSDIVSCQTQCDPMAIPYADNFNNYTGYTIGTSYTTANTDIPDCWDYIYTGTTNTSSTSYKPKLMKGTYGVISTTDTCVMVLASTNTSYGENNMLILPVFATPLDSIYMSFDYTLYNTTTGDLQLGYLTYAEDTTFTALKTFPRVAYNGEPRYKTAELFLADELTQPVANARLAFRYATNSSSLGFACIDNLKVEKVQACRRPSGIQATNITHNSATLTWNASGNELEYLISCYAQGAAGIEEMSSTNSINLTNLQPNSTYQVEIMADCGNDGQSVISSVYTFTTACDAFVVTPSTPFFNDFDTLTAGIPECWDNSEGTVTNNSYRWNFYATGYAGVGLRFNSNNAPLFETNFLKTRALDLSSIANGAEVSFKCKYPNVTTVGRLDVFLVSGNDTLTVASAVSGVTSWSEFKYDISAFTGAGYDWVYLVFKGTSDYGSAYIDIDDVKVKAHADCRVPDNVRVAAATDQVTIAWDAVEGANAYNVQYAGQDFEPGTLTSVTTTSTSYTISNLTMDTTLYVYVQADCGQVDGLSEWTEDALQVHTLNCAPITITEAAPFMEDFSQWTANTTTTNSATAQFPTCWYNQFVSTSTSDYTPHVYSGTYAPTASNKSLIMAASSTYIPAMYVSLPQFTNDMSDLQLSFATSMESRIYGALTLGYMTDPHNGASFVALERIPNNYYGDAATRRAVHHFYLSDLGAIPTGSLLAFRWTCTSTSTYYVCIDDVQVSIAPSCLPPTTVNIEPSVTTAEVTWTPRSNETAWSYKYGLAGFNPAVDSTVIGTAVVTAADLPLTLTNLTPNTAYDFYVSSTCSQEQSDLQGPISFRTLCDVITITEDAPFTEDFSDWTANTSTTITATTAADFPTCWYNSFLSVSTSDYSPHVYSGTYAPTASDKSLIMTANSNFIPAMYVSLPQFTNDMSDLQLSFATSMYSATYGIFTLGYMTDPHNESTFVVLDTIPNNYYSNAETRRVEHFYLLRRFGNIPTGSFLTFRWSANRTSYDYVCIDDVQVSFVPPCVNPINAEVVSSAAEEATFTWRSRGSETSWEVACVPAGSGVPTSGTVVTDDTTTINQLLPNTEYDFYVRAICSALEVSPWSSPRTFTTKCLPLTLPYYENFNNYYASTAYYSSTADTVARWQQPDCWDITATANGSTQTTPHIYRGSYSVYERALVMAGAPNSLVILPEFNTLSNVEVLFKTVMYSASYGSLRLGYVADSTFTTLVTVPSNVYSSGWVERYYDLSSYTIPAGARLAFQFYYSSNSTTYNCMIDDLQVREIRTCKAPEDLTFVSSTETTAQFTWTPDSTEQNWVIEYGPYGFTPGTGTTSAVSSTDTVVTHTITNLNASSTYDAYIYAVCGAEDMSYAEGPVSFATQCGTITISETNIFFEDFEFYTPATNISTTTPDRPRCWDYTYNGTSTSNYSPHAYRGTYNGSRSIGYMMVCGSATYGNPAQVILPSFTNDLSDLQISFTTDMSSASPDASLQLGYVTYTGTTPTFVSLTTIANNYYSSSPAARHTIELGTYPTIPAGARLAFQWSTASTSSYYCVIDEVEVKLGPDCFSVNDIAVTAITDNMAALAWSANGNTAWTVAYKLSDVEDAAATTITVTQPTVTLNGLTSETTYEVIVTPVCQGVVYPSEPCYFTTECQAIALPYNENFQSYAPVSSISATTGTSLPDCWSFIYNGTANYAPKVYNGTSYINSVSTNNVLGMVVGGSPGPINYAIMPRLNADLSALTVSFDYRFESLTAVQADFGYITSAADASTFVTLAALEPVTGTFESVTFNLAEYPSIPSHARLAFKVYTTSTSWYCFGVDNVSVALPTIACLPPTDVAVSQVKHNSALVNWSNTDPSITGWVVRYTDGVSEQTVTTTDTFVSIQNLVPETAYTVTVKPICGGYAPASTPVQFVTGCAPILITRTNTYTEDFTGVSAGVGSIPSCWDANYQGLDPDEAPQVVNTANTPTPNNNALAMNETSVAVLPLFANPMEDLRVEFTTKVSAANGTLELGYVTNPADASTFTALTTVTTTTTVGQHEERVYNLLATSQTIPAESRLAFKWAATQTSSTLFIDDVEVSLYQIYDTNLVSACDSYTDANGTVYTQTSVSVNTVTETDYLHHYVDLIQINYSTQVTVDEDACGTYVWGDTTITTSGQYTRILQTAAGCDSLVTLNLTIRSTSSDTSVVVACDSYTWTEGDGRTYRSSRVVSHTLTDQYGCDSTLVLDLTINITEHTVDVQEACGSYTWVDGVTYTASTDTPTYTTTSSAGCDSIVTLNLTIRPEVQTDTNAAACGSFTWTLSGQTYTESGDYPVTLTSQYGCDSVVTLHLTIFEMPVVTITGDTEIAAGESTTLTATDNPAWNYVWSTGDRTSEVTVSPAATTTYTLIVSNGPCVYNGAVTVSVSTGIHDFSTAVDRLFPMPADQYCIVEAENMKAINVYNANGQMVASYAVDRADRHRIATASYAQGVYFVKVITTDNRVLTAKMVVKH